MRVPARFAAGRWEADIKRSTAITLILAGTGVAAVVAATQNRVCHDEQGQQVACRSGSSTSSSSARGVSRAAQSIARGGFGSSGRSGGG
jgi:hypothetical protein